MLNMLGGNNEVSVSIKVPRADEKFFQSDRAALTSWARLSIQ